MRLSALHAGRSLPPGRFLVLISDSGWVDSRAGRIRWTVKSSELIGNRTRDLPACSIVPQTTTLPCAPIQELKHKLFKHAVMSSTARSPLSSVPLRFDVNHAYYTYIHSPIAVAARSKTWSLFAPSNAAIVGSNPTQGIDVCVRLFCVCFVLCVGSGLATGWSPVQGVLPTVYRIKKLKKTAKVRQRPVEP
jgi:hypothetical protein